MQPRISLITLGVENLEASAKFYRDGLGLPQLESPPTVAFFKLAGTWLGLYGHDELAKDATVSPEGSGFHGVTLSYNVINEDEVHRVLGIARDAGAEITKEPQKASWGGFHAYFKDPDGHLWEIAYNPHLWIGPPDCAGWTAS